MIFDATKALCCFAACLAATAAQAAEASDRCASPHVQSIVKSKVLMDFDEHTNFGSVFDLGLSNFQVIDTKTVSATDRATVCEGRFITSFTVKAGHVAKPKTMTALSSIARYEVSEGADAGRLDVKIMHRIDGRVLVCYADETCGPMQSLPR